MNIKRAKQEIKDTIEAYLEKDEFGAYVIPVVRQRPVLLIGPPGVGKTQIMEQISQECQIGLVSYTITHHTRQSAIGLPFIERKEYGGREYAVTEYTMSEIVASVYEKMERSGLKEGILFIDEINCVSETLAPAMLQFLQAKTFGSHKIPEGWIIVAAGNPPEYNKSVRDFDIVTLDRIRRIEVEPDFEVWKEYAVQAGIHPAIRTYLNVRCQNFCQIETTVDGKLFATPRGWEDLSQLVEVYERQGRTVDRELAAEYIQFPKIAKDFANYLELYNKYRDDYQVDRVLEGELSEAIVDKLQRAPFDERVSVIGLLLSGLNQKFKLLAVAGEEMSLRMEKLREFHVQAENDEIGEKAIADGFADMLETFCGEWERLRESELLSRRELHRHQAVTAKLEEDLQALRKEQPVDMAQAWELMRRRFGADSDQYEVLAEAAGTALEHAFDFMEAAFGVSQEMALFVTELNTGFYSVEFLKGYECKRYYQYNRDLLFVEEERKIGELLRQ